MKAKRLIYIMTGHNFMNKLSLFFILLLASCAHIDYLSLPKTTLTFIRGAEDFSISKEFYDQQEYSFLKLRRGRIGTSIFVLSEVDSNGDFIWVSAELEKLITRNGKVIKLYSDPEISFQTINIPRYFEGNSSTEYFIELKQPMAILEQTSTLIYEQDEIIPWLDDKLETELFQEEINTKKFHWSFRNYYWLYEGNVLKTEQFIHPNLPKITIEFYFK